MQRIIITEKDNTSNVEGLSSYDIVYVPGFASKNLSPSYTEDGPSLFRNPTLVTSKYDFIQKFGDCPTFSTDQPYPVASEKNTGFPSYAIPGYSYSSSPTGPVEVDDVVTIVCETGEDPVEKITGTGYYQSVGTINNVWEPLPEITYYLATGTTEETTTTYTMSALTDAAKDPDPEINYKGKLIFTSDFSPVDNKWMILYNDELHYTSDNYIDFNTSGSALTTVKTYYLPIENVPKMFNGPTGETPGDPDPGYRYALYLLSLGIPVYYEQMNSDFEKVDLNDPQNIGASPIGRGWFVNVSGNQYIRSSDTEIKPGVDYWIGADISITSLYQGLEARFSGGTDEEEYSIDSMGDYAVKYITSGGYPTFEYGTLAPDNNDGNMYVIGSPLAEGMISTASRRGDAVALIDHTNAPNRAIHVTDTYSVVTRARQGFSSLTPELGSYGAMFTPWYICTHPAVSGGTELAYGTNTAISQMPASLAFLSALARQLQNQNPWLAVAGVSRGQVPYFGGLHTNYKLTNNVADSYQVIPGDTSDMGLPAISINPITNIRNYGYCIWGNRTLRNNTSGKGTKATSFLNIRDVVSDIKKRLYEASQGLLFEQNTDVLWLNFKNIITPLLETMQSNYILDNYNLVKYNIDPETGEPVPSYKVLAAIRIVPIASVEVFELQVSLENREFMIAEVE